METIFNALAEPCGPIRARYWMKTLLNQTRRYARKCFAEIWNYCIIFLPLAEPRAHPSHIHNGEIAFEDIITVMSQYVSPKWTTELLTLVSDTLAHLIPIWTSVLCVGQTWTVDASVLSQWFNPVVTLINIIKDDDGMSQHHCFLIVNNTARRRGATCPPVAVPSLPPSD